MEIPMLSSYVAQETASSTEARVLVRVEGLKKAFGAQVVLDGVDLEIRQGEVVLLRGENASGKTTLINILTGNVEPGAGVIDYLVDSTPRTYHFPKRWWQELNPFDHFTPESVAREGVGRTWQDVRLFGSQSLRDNIAVAEPAHPGENPVLALFIPKRFTSREAEINREADAMLARFGLAGRETSSADKISLGQSKRVAIVRAMAAGAKILFLDEPLAGLDRQGISDVLALLESLVRERKVTLVIVEHLFNQSYLQGLITTDWLLEKGRITVSDPRLTTGNRRTENASRPPWFNLLVDKDAEILDEPLPGGATLSRIRRADRFRQSKPVIELRNLVVKRGPRTVIGLDDHSELTGLNLILYEGESAVLQAPNGWGKTTLLEAIAGVIPIDRGTVLLNGEPTGNLPPWTRVKLGLSFLQARNQVFPNLTVEETLRLARARNTPDNIQDLKKRQVSNLSGGEKQRVTLAATSSFSLRLLDEPFSALDNRALEETWIGLLRHLGESGLLVAVPYSRANE
jgi:ABC-type branched-subunit amino acid transport system ATPase component